MQCDNRQVVCKKELDRKQAMTLLKELMQKIWSKYPYFNVYSKAQLLLDIKKAYSENYEPNKRKKI